MNALFIGRFQPFHKGHLIVLQRLSTQYDGIIIGIGSSQYHDTTENPFSSEERVQMITQSLNDVGIHSYQIIPITDIHDPPHWVDHVCSLVPDFDVVIANNHLTRKLFSEKGYKVKGTEYFNRKQYSGKEIRRRMINNEPWKESVPTAVVKIIQNTHGIERLKHLSS